MPPTIPDFKSDEWNSQRQALQDELREVSVKLADHMCSPGGFKGRLEFDMEDGRTLYVTLEAGCRPKAN